MSQLGVNNNNGNYFSNTEEVYNLIKMLLKEIYSKDISDLGMDLLYNKNSTLLEIQSRLKLSFENVRNYLIIMLQNNLIQKKTITRNEIKYTAYELKCEQILNILLFPRLLSFIEKKYGNYGKMIFEQFILVGILTLRQIIEHINNSYNNGNNFELLKAQVVEFFVKLYEDNLIMYSERTNDEENYYSSSPNKYNNLINKENNKKNNKKFSNKKNKNNKNKKSEVDIKSSININEKIDEEEEKRILDIVDKSQNDKNLNKNDLFYENNTKNNMHFYINFEQILVEFQSEIIIDYINNNISHQSALLAGYLLKNHKISSFSLGMSELINIDELAKNFKSISLNQIEEIIKNNPEIFSKSNSDDIYLNINKIKKEIKSKVIQQMIITKFSKEHFRVYNLLNKIGALDGKNITDLCLIIPKKVNYIINQLLQEGIIKTNSVDFNGNDMLFYSVDEYQTSEHFLSMDYKMIINYKSYYNAQLNNIKNKLGDKKKQNEDLIKLTYIIDQICENIIIMKYF